MSLIVDTDPQATASQRAAWRHDAPPEVIDSPPARLAAKVAAAPGQGADLVVIDTPPHADSAARAAVEVADLVLITCRPSAFGLAAIQTTAKLVHLLRKPAFVVFTAGPLNAPRVYQEVGAGGRSRHARLPGDPRRPRRLSPCQRRGAYRARDRARRQGGRGGAGDLHVDVSTDRHDDIAPEEEPLMSRKPSFANLRGHTPALAAAPPARCPPSRTGQGHPPRQPRRPKQIAGLFSPDMSLAMHILARRRGRSLQALMAEAFNDVLRKHGECPICD
ncbi:MAG: ribbon-helix-helix domain-containing protein [Janthinobacterium lividum]